MAEPQMVGQAQSLPQLHRSNMCLQGMYGPEVHLLDAFEGLLRACTMQHRDVQGGQARILIGLICALATPVKVA